MIQAKRRELLAKQLSGLVTFFLLIAVATCVTYAGQPVIWETSSRAELLKGDARGVSIGDTGMLTLAPRLTEVFNTEQAFVWSGAVDAQGNVYLGTGHDGKIFRVSPDGRGSLFYDASELDVTALAASRDGALYAGTSPDGKVYRITFGPWQFLTTDRLRSAPVIMASSTVYAQPAPSRSRRSLLLRTRHTSSRLHLPRRGI
jgi:outer membrane protein assembly factor BamB